MEIGFLEFKEGIYGYCVVLGGVLIVLFRKGFFKGFMVKDKIEGRSRVYIYVRKCLLFWYKIVF